METEKTAAVVTIKNAAMMSPAGARRVAKWLRKQAELLETSKTRQALSDRYRARYLYED